MLTTIYTTIFYQPILNLLIFLYNILPGQDIGFAIIVLTVIVKAILLLPSAQSIRSQRALQSIQPEIDALKQKYGKDKEGLAKELMGVYKRNKVNPLSSCFPVIIQLPFLIAVYQAFRAGLASTENLGALLYPFVARPATIHTMFLWFLDLAKPSIVLAVLAGLAQWWQTKMLMHKRPPIKVPGSKDEDMAAIINKQMIYMMPVMTVVISMSLPSGLALYWLVTTLLTVVQQLYIFKQQPHAAVMPLPHGTHQKQ